MLCGTLEIRFAPWVGWTISRFGNPDTWMPCSVRIPPAQCYDSVTPPRPVTSNPARRAYGVPTSNPDA